MQERRIMLVAGMLPALCSFTRREGWGREGGFEIDDE